jgi:hypothetical protein
VDYRQVHTVEFGNWRPIVNPGATDEP